MATIQDTAGTTHDEAQLRYLRAAELAQQRQYPEAESEFTAALSINPALHTARFQLGLLQLTNANVAAARLTWSPLLDPKVPLDLQHFVRGLDALIHDDFTTAIAHLQTGISLNHVNAPLNKDMNMVIEKIRGVMDSPSPASPTGEKSGQTRDDGSQRTDFSLYDKKY